MELPDIQDQVDDRGIELDRVGIAGVRYPVRFDDGVTRQAGVATFDVTVTLPADRRGTHMSRMVEIIHDELQELEPQRLPQALKAAGGRLEVGDVQVSIMLPITILVPAPATGKESWQACDVELKVARTRDETELALTVGADVTSLCPCSKAISDYGAHNQRSHVQLTTFGRSDDIYPLDVATLFAMIREVGSSPVFPLIKRPDERAVTMTAHDHPVPATWG
jgi:GTP cyclohydrolase I